jgi:hypothetical protein
MRKDEAIDDLQDTPSGFSNVDTVSREALWVTVLFTSVPATLRALQTAGQLASKLGACVRILVPQVVPYAALTPAAIPRIAFEIGSESSMATVFGVNYFYRSTTTISPDQRQLQPFPKQTSPLHWCWPEQRVRLCRDAP